MKRTASAIWKGSGKEGTGSLSTQSGVFKKQSYSAKLRFENEDGQLGTNPEELIAAAHAGCFSMALAFQLNASGFTADHINTDALLVMDKTDAGWTIKSITLTVKAKISEISQNKFNELANNAKAGCPVSRVLNCDIFMEAHLE